MAESTSPLQGPDGPVVAGSAVNVDRPRSESRGGGLDNALLLPEDRAAVGVDPSPEPANFGMETEAPDVGLAGDGDGLAHRKHVADTNLTKGAFHVFKANVGIGMFLLPLVYGDCGFALSPLLAVPIGLVVMDCMMVLLATKVKIRRETVQTYPQVVDFVFGSFGRLLTNIALVVVQFSFCLMYIQTSAGIVEKIAPFTGSYKVFVVVAYVLTLPLTFYSDNMSLLSYSSAAATFLVWFTAVTTVVYACMQISRQGGVAPTVTVAGDVSKWPLFIASNFTVLEGIGVVLPVENATAPSLKHRVPGLVRRTMLALVALYLVYGTVGYLAWGGTLTASTVNVLPDSWFGDVVRIGLAVNLLLTHPLQFVPAIETIDASLGVARDRIRRSKKAISVRLLVNTVNMLIALLIGEDTLALVLALIGATAAIVIAMILPGLLALHVDYAIENELAPRRGRAYYRQLWRPVGGWNFRKVRYAMYVVVGLLVAVMSTATVAVDTAALINRKTHRSLPMTGGDTK